MTTVKYISSPRTSWKISSTVCAIVKFVVFMIPAVLTFHSAFDLSYFPHDLSMFQELRLDGSSSERELDAHTLAKDRASLKQGLPAIHGTASNSQFAYAWLLGGVNPEKPGYKGFLYTILMSIDYLRNFGSKADFVVYVQLSPDNPRDSLDEAEARFLEKSGARVVYLKKPKKESFSQIVYEKLRPLELTEYRRVQFLDGDLLPLRNMDYIFEQSMGENALLAPNMIHATGGEPCNAGWFMLEPSKEALGNLQSVVSAQRQQAKDLPYPKFDRKWGWGHNFEKHKDHWEGTLKNGTRWNYHASHSDQGLLYYWVKYHVQNVSILINTKIQRWGPGLDKDHPILLNQMESTVLDRWSEPIPGCRDSSLILPTCPAVYRDFAHFFGGAKPWGKRRSRAGNAGRWHDGLETINKKFMMNLNLSNWESFRAKLAEPPLGRMAMWSDHSQQVEEETNQTSAQ